MAFVKTRVLGKGSFGTVFLAESQYAKPIAVKTTYYHPQLLDSLITEQVIMECLNGCPEILQCYGTQFTVEDGKSMCNLLLEYAPHGTLKHHITANKILPEIEVRIYTQMILKGLSFMHGQGFVHCDLKPDNILLFPPSEEEDTYQLKISDFGLSKTSTEAIDSAFWTLNFRGTPYYMSPESIEYGVIDAPLDIWSLGCIVIEMISGHVAWENIPDSKTLMHKLIIDKAVPKIPDKVSEYCKDFLDRCFLRDTRDRWTAEKLLTHPFVQFF